MIGFHPIQFICVECTWSHSYHWDNMEIDEVKSVVYQEMFEMQWKNVRSSLSLCKTLKLTE